MAQVVSFREDVHEYRLPDGTVIPSVSEILRFMSREIYGGITQWTLDNAADRGTRVHKACEVLDKWGEVECEPDIEPQVRAYVKFCNDYKPQWDSVERAVCNTELGYAGTIDRGGRMNSKKVLVDIKAQEQIKKPLVNAQVNGYNQIYGAEELYCLQLKKDGTYRLHSIDLDVSEFMACLTLHKALQKKPRKKKGDADGNTDE